MSELYLPGRMGRIVLQGMEEILGHEGLLSVLKGAGVPSAGEDQAFPFSFFGRVSEALESQHGVLAGRGIALRAGRASFSYALSAYSTASPIADSSFRVMPFPAKLRTAGQAMAELLNRQANQGVSMEEKDGAVLWHIERCPLCWQRRTAEAACHFAVGFAQEALYWLSGGKIFQVEEIACVARGDLACTLHIDSVPFS